MDRSRDWLRQAERDLELARSGAREGFYEHTCFLAQQAAEKAVKGVCQASKAEAWGHMISRLLRDLAPTVQTPDDIMDAAKSLDQHYILSRYPNGFESGIPGDYYTAQDAEGATTRAERIIAFCKQHIPG